MSNKALLTIIIVLLIGIGSILLVQVTHDSPLENIGESISSVFDETADEIDSEM